MDIKKGNNKFYVEDNEGNEIARATFKRSGNNIIVIDHTLVDPSLRGQGMAGKLVDEIVKMAREEDLKIVPVCSYAVHRLTKSDEYEDVLLKN